MENTSKLCSFACFFSDRDVELSFTYTQEDVLTVHLKLVFDACDTLLCIVLIIPLQLYTYLFHHT